MGSKEQGIQETAWNWIKGTPRVLVREGPKQGQSSEKPVQSGIGQERVSLQEDEVKK